MTFTTVAVGAFYLSDAEGAGAVGRLAAWRTDVEERAAVKRIPVYTRTELPRLISRLHEIHQRVAA